MSPRFSLSTPYSVELVTDEFEHEHLSIRRIRGREAISQLYRYEVLLVSRERAPGGDPIDPDDIVGSTVRLELLDKDRELVRVVHGIVASVEQLAHESAREHPAYQLEVVPRVWDLSLATTQEVDMGLTVPEIIANKLELHGLDGYGVFNLAAKYPKRDFILQYKESDLAFICRLAEHVGIGFYFDHGEDGETMVFSDGSSGYLRAPDRKVAFSARGEKQGVYQIAARTRTIPATYVVQDYNHRHPQLDVTGVHRLDIGSGGLVEYGTHHKTPEEGNTLAAIRAEESLSRRRVYRGQSDAVGFTAGACVEITDHPFHQHPELLLTEVEHRFEQTLGGDDSATQGYENSFTAVPTSHNYRPPRITPRPRIDGILTAVVQVGSDAEMGSAAVVDENGYYMVQFHFDSVAEGAKASRPVRMAQPFEGPDEGMHFPLRPGTEVAIAFIDGDPDRPIIVGALPNATTPSPVVAGEAHVHRVRTRHGFVMEFGTTSSK